jgi:regulator of protease activity HflC (stomatin/prohibitin superfamily)
LNESLFLSLQRSNVVFSPILYVLPVIVIVGFFLITASVTILREYERAVVFTLGRFQKVKGPGLVLLIPFVQEMVRVGLAHPGDRDSKPGRNFA